uniref:Activin_recp domain-containing protein n=1 Tax=Ascaris lumbricoides TaxID=6252 RepID=A0A0M3I2H6_ASCLU
MCYSEYYLVTLNNGRKREYFDRFCAYGIDCEYRGLAEICVSVSQLDPTVRATFTAQIAKYGYSEKNLLHSRFCCCSTDLCNDFGVDDARGEFNLSVIAGLSIGSICSIHWLVVMLINLLSIF